MGFLNVCVGGRSKISFSGARALACYLSLADYSANERQLLRSSSGEHHNLLVHKKT
jgi:hypothetical protein